MWVSLTRSFDNRIVAGTIGEVKSTKDGYHEIYHWHFTDETFKARIEDCEVFTPLKTASYKGIPCKVVKYLEDYPTGMSSHSSMTGRRVLLEDSEGNQLDVLVANLD